MINHYTIIFRGWKIEKENVGSFEDDLDEAGYWDDDELFDGRVVVDSMCGNYCYFGTQIKSFDNDEDDDWCYEVNSLDESKAWEDFSKWRNEHPEIWQKFGKKYCNGTPRTYIFQYCC